ncbi:hypothetical protein ACIRG5_01610 [Lentzea sp. NPDC102401]
MTQWLNLNGTAARYTFRAVTEQCSGNNPDRSWRDGHRALI